MVYIFKKPHQYDPYHLPGAINFHLATKTLDLTRAQKVKLQSALSKLDYRKLKKNIEYLKEMRIDAMKRNNYKMAAYCKACAEFAEKYFYSLKVQEKI